MVEKTIEKQWINLSNLEIYEFCRLNIESGQKDFGIQYENMGEISGFYYRDTQKFFALISVTQGLIIFYEGNLYDLTPDLHIHIDKRNGINIFYIDEYKIMIPYYESEYIDIDVWSTREDVDLFYQIEQSYKNPDYYKKFSK